MLRRQFGMSYQDWRNEPAWYIDLLLDHLQAEETARGSGPDTAPPDTLAEWR